MGLESTDEILVHSKSGTVSKTSLEAIAAGQILGGETGQGVTAVVLGSGSQSLAQDIAAGMRRRPERGFRPAGYLGEDNPAFVGEIHLGRMDQLAELAECNAIGDGRCPARRLRTSLRISFHFLSSSSPACCSTLCEESAIALVNVTVISSVRAKTEPTSVGSMPE